MRDKKVLFITQASMIAALYVVLTLLANALGLANYAIQIRFSEALTILPFSSFSTVPHSFPGRTIGCLLSNLLTGCMPLDILFGSLATLLGAIGTYALRRFLWAAPIPPILANTLIVPFILAYVYQFDGSIPYFMLTVGIGELLSCGVLGMVLLGILMKYRNVIFQAGVSDKKTLPAKKTDRLS